MKAISKVNGQYTCNRCGNTNQSLFSSTPCNTCGGCVYCRNCLWLGKKTMCEQLDDVNLNYELYNNTFKIDYELSDLQKDASNYIIEHINNPMDTIIWAVCGAGKTEIVFEVIDRYLNMGKLVCFAIPRVDVVKELRERMEQAFKFPIYAHYGSSPDMDQFSQLMIMTTHQLLKYKNTFDLIVIDEVDAFPYSTDQSLHFGLKTALKANGKVIYLTATPSLYFKFLIHSNKINFYLLPSRFHRKQLDIPQMIYVGNWKKVNNKIRQIIDSYTKPLLIFVPTIDLLEYYSTELKLPAIHSASENRSELIQAFKSGQIKKLLTTTILERGITIKDLNVLVIGSEHRLYNEQSLVQIAGRVGRKMDSPHGDILFLYQSISYGMIKSILHIRKMNRIARKRGTIE